MTTLEILEAARALIAERKHWCRGVYAKDSKGNDVYPPWPDAVRWCGGGAVMQVAGAIDRARPLAFLRGACNEPINTFNDKRGHKAVLEAYDRAIERAK